MPKEKLGLGTTQRTPSDIYRAEGGTGVGDGAALARHWGGIYPSQRLPAAMGERRLHTAAKGTP